MANGRRKVKHPRAQLRPSDPINHRRVHRQRLRRQIISLIPVILAVPLVAAIVAGSGPPFTYRIGQRPEKDLRVSVEQFQRFNSVRTSQARDLAAKQVPPVFQNDPAPILELRNQFHNLLESIARTKPTSLDLLPKGSAELWVLEQEDLQRIREAVENETDLVELLEQVDSAFEPLIKHGVLPIGALGSLEKESSSKIQVHHPASVENVDRDLVIPERLAQPDGPVAEAFVAQFNDPVLGDLLFRLVGNRLTRISTLSLDELETDNLRTTARETVGDQFDTFYRGNLLVEQGTLIDEEQLELLRLEHRERLSTMGITSKVKRAASILVLISALFGLMGIYISRYEPRVARSPARIATLCIAAIIGLGLARLLALWIWSAELIPIALIAMTLAIAYNPLLSLVFVFGTSLLLCMSTGQGLSYLIVLIGGTAAGVMLLREVRTRTKPILVGVVAGVTYAVLSAASGVWQNQSIQLIVTESAMRASWGLLSGFLLLGCLPFAERAFGLMTGISLLELGDVTHPLIQQLVRRAPGTHNHSITVGTIAESAAKTVGADALLVRIGAYFHDIGKMVKPHYFIENQVPGGPNRHENLAPAMSTLIIIGHVKDGAELGRQHHLPERIIDLIEQHHGTTLVEYFYHRANQQRVEDDRPGIVQESAFRYPGPKPQSKEAAILMMADGVESASRTLFDPTPARLEGLVSAIVDKRLRDGQFDESDLTLRDIATIRESLIKSLIAIYHGRVTYPEQRTA